MSYSYELFVQEKDFFMYKEMSYSNEEISYA